MNDTPSLSSQCWHFPFPRCAAAMLFALAWSSLAFGGEIQDAVQKGDLAKVKELLKNNPALVSSKDTNGWTPLHWAAANGYGTIAELLLAKKAEVDAKEKYDTTPLYLTALNGHKDVAELLLANKADVNAKDRNGDTPLHAAVAGGRRYGVGLSVAAAKGKQDAAELLRQHGGHE